LTLSFVPWRYFRERRSKAGGGESRKHPGPRTGEDLKRLPPASPGLIRGSQQAAYFT